MEAFTTSTGVRIEVKIELGSRFGTAALVVSGKASMGIGVLVEPVPSASVLLSSGSTSFRTMEAALLNLLYQIDGQLAEREWKMLERRKE